MVTKRKVITHRWITIPTYSANVEGMNEYKTYRQIREGTFPFRFKRFGRGIRIDAVDAGLLEGPQNDDRQPQESLAATA